MKCDRHRSAAQNEARAEPAATLYKFFQRDECAATVDRVHVVKNEQRFAFDLAQRLSEAAADLFGRTEHGRVFGIDWTSVNSPSAQCRVEMRGEDGEIGICRLERIPE